MCVCVCARVHACVYMHVCVCVSVCLSVSVSLCVCMSVCTYLCGSSNRMGKLSTFEIVLDNAKGVYYPGQNVEGHCNIVLNREMQMRGL